MHAFGRACPKCQLRRDPGGRRSIQVEIASDYRKQPCSVQPAVHGIVAPVGKVADDMKVALRVWSLLICVVKNCQKRFVAAGVAANSAGSAGQGDKFGPVISLAPDQ